MLMDDETLYSTGQMQHCCAVLILMSWVVCVRFNLHIASVDPKYFEHPAIPFLNVGNAREQ